MKPKLLATTEKWIVIDKPAGWLTIPPSAAFRGGGGEPRPVLSEWVRAEVGEGHVVHRLDVETSGTLLFARTPEAHREASLWFQEHRVRKTYHALAAGSPSAPLFRVREPVRGAPALTQIEVKERFPGAFLAQALPISGKRHQIRIHLASKGHPILGDRDYGGMPELQTGGIHIKVGRVALHAFRLELPGGERFEAAWPEDFSGWIETLRQARDLQ